MEYALLPKFLQFELTYACNSACTFCYNPNHKKQFDEDRRFSILRQLNRYRIDHVQLIGGEVTLLPRLPEYLDVLDNVRWRSVVTNGRILVRELAGRVNEIYLSLHGDEDSHERITNAEHSFKDIESSIDFYVGAGIEVQSDTVLTSQNYHLIYEIARIATGKGMSVLFVNVFQPAGIGRHFAEQLIPTVSQIREAITQMIAARDEFGIKVSFGTSTPFCLDERLITENLAFTCGVGAWFASIDPMGEFRICNQSAKSYGNILDRPLHQIWHSRQLNEEYRLGNWLQKPCNSCIFRMDCLGGCRVRDDGSTRVDPIVEREPEALLAPAVLGGLYQLFQNRSEAQI